MICSGRAGLTAGGFGLAWTAICFGVRFLGCDLRAITSGSSSFQRCDLHAAQRLTFLGSASGLSFVRFGIHSAVHTWHLQTGRVMIAMHQRYIYVV